MIGGPGDSMSKEDKEFYARQRKERDHEDRLSALEKALEGIKETVESIQASIRKNSGAENQ